MRESNLQSRDFNVPLEYKERNEIRRYVSHNKSYDDDTRTEISRSEPPAKFSFLSGIHPDLDEALCEIQTPNAKSRRSEQRRRPNDLTSSGKMGSSYFDEREGSAKDISKKEYEVSKRNVHDDKSKENLTQDEFKMERYSTKLETSISDVYCSSTIGSFGPRAVESVDSVAESVFSKPREITYIKGANDSIDSLPFSLDGMERAKRRIKSQAAKIRDLEFKLERAASINGSNNGEEEDAQQATLKKVMSPDERLQAHMQRKRLENKYKEQSGKWNKPPPLKHEKIASKVKRKDKLVDRLIASPKERKRQDEVKKRLKRAMNKYERDTSDDELNEDEEYPVSRRSSNEKMKKPKVKSKKTKKKKSAGNLMERLNMNVKERRGLKKNTDDLTDNLKRTLRGHRIRKKSWKMSNEFDGGRSDDGSSANDESDYTNESYTEKSIKCITCKSAKNCEEDADNPGVYYCAICWNNYEENQEGSLHGEENNYDDDSFRSRPEYEPRQSSAKHTKTYDEALWIVHDNPKLKGSLTWSGSNKMNCLVETKDPVRKNCVRMLRGVIEYCGTVHDSGMGDSQVNETGRGTECIRIGNIDAFVIDHDEVETRLASNKSIQEFRLDPNRAIQLTGRNAQMRLKDFLSNCTRAVDIIFAPQSSPGGWYPHREASSNSRKIAPQFRSNGFGYLRLGDDMGNNGLAFLSSDSLNSFFSTEPVEQIEVNEELRRTTTSFASKRGHEQLSKRNSSKKIQPLKKRSDLASKRSSQKMLVEDEFDNDDDDYDSVSSSSSVSSSDDEDGDKHDKRDADTLLKDLRNFEVTKSVKSKWQEKADLLNSLGKAIVKPKGRATCSNALNYIQDVISSKNVNINVLRGALVVVERIGESMQSELSHHISWKTILIEMLKLLKNKQVGNGAREILRKLHCSNCFTLGNSMVAVSHVLGMGKTTNQRKSMGSNKNTPSNKNNQSMQKANNVETIQWLAQATEFEREMEEIDPKMDESGLSQLVYFFSSHQSHRDARCRKNSLDGLLHTVLYGIKILGMEKTDALNLCSELKAMNPRSWTGLTKSVNFALKGRKRSAKR